jgi:hypothetical protein
MVVAVAAAAVRNGSASANRAAAEVAAPRLLALVQLPSGSVLSATGRRVTVAP